MTGKVLVTGAGGFIGGYLVKALDAKGYDVRASSVVRPDYLREGKLKNTEFLSANMVDAETLMAAVEGVSRVYHTAAIFNFYDDEKLLHRVNAEGTDDLARLAREAGVKEFINWSSGAIYGLAYGNKAASEKDEPMPNDKYTRSKWAQEQAAFSYNGQYMKVLTLRPAAVYGAGSAYGDAKAMYLLKRGVLCIIPGLRDYFSSHVHVDDVIAAAIHLSEKENAYQPEAHKPAEVAFNIADDEPMSAKDLLKTASGMIKKKGLLGFIPVRFPVLPVRAVAWVSEMWGRLRNKPPLVEIDAIDYIAGGHAMTNDKLKATDYQLKHPTIKEAIGEIIDWYERTDWQVFK